MRTRSTSWHALACGLAVALGCGAPAAWRYERALEETRPPSDHAVHQTRLVELMRDLDQLRRERLPAALDPHEERRRRAEEIARVAEAMAVSATRIPAAAPERLDAEEREAYLALAEQLRRQCEALAAEAPQLAARPMRDRLMEIDSTCRRCHDRFRIPGLEGRE